MTSDGNPLLPKQLSGTWHIIATNFPMWLKGDKHSPTFNYSPIQKKGKEILVDEVKYVKNGKTHTITGYDYPDTGNNNAFVWRGKGLLGMLRSRWQLVLMDEHQQWAVIYFSKTLFTPAGADVIARNTTLSEAELTAIIQQISAHPLLGQYFVSIKPICILVPN